jgi:oligoribonuclease
MGGPVFLFPHSFEERRPRISAAARKHRLLAHAEAIMKRNPENLVWIDLETTGLNVDRRAILEIAAIVTDKDLNVLEEGPSLVIHHPSAVLSRLDAWCRGQHGESGLLKESAQSTISLDEAERRTLDLIRKHCPPKRSPLCGNSICFDRRFLIRYMPKLEAYLNYRNVDVSSIKELVQRWYAGGLQKQEKSSSHRALDDIRESIDELRLYRRLVFKDAHADRRVA